MGEHRTAALGASAQSEPFALTDIQQAYWIGRQQGLELGGVSTHAYLEIDIRDLDFERMQSVWRHLIDRHPMLRAIVLPSGEQQVLDSPPPFRLALADLRGLSVEETQRRLLAMREEWSHEVVPADRWPLFRVRTTLIDERTARLHLGFDALVTDGRSRALILRECVELYRDPAARLPALGATFPEFVQRAQAARRSERHHRAREYWSQRLADLPEPPALPLSADRDPSAVPRFERMQTFLDAATLADLERHASAHDLRITPVLLAVFASVLARWSNRRALTINLTLFDRLGREERYEGVVGDFTTLMLLAVENAACGTFAERARALREGLRADLDYTDVSAVELIRELRRRRGGTPGPSMPVVFTSMIQSDRVRGSVYEHAERLGDVVYSIGQTPQVWIDSFACLVRGRLYLFWDHVVALFPPGMMRDMFAAYTGTLRRLASDPDAWIEPWRATAVSMLPDHERRRADAGERQPLPGTGGGLHQPFFRRCAEDPDATAIIDGDQQLSYADTARHALAVARALRDCGVVAGSRVAVIMEKGWEQVAAVLGALAAGTVFVPIDPNIPGRRLGELLRDSAAECILTQTRLRGQLDGTGTVPVLSVDHLPPAGDAAVEPVQPAADDLAYVIYTSGSTGRPKGVMISHRGALNTIADINDRFGVGPEDRVLGLSALSFDLSIYDVFGTLAAGATLVLPDPRRTRDPAHWLNLLRRHRVTVWNSVPALMGLLVEHANSGGAQGAIPHLRLALLSGDWIPLSLPEAARRAAPGARLISLGGATEGSIWSIFFPIEQVDPAWRSIPYGRPLRNQSMLVLDDALQPCPTWVPGELYIGGEGVALGYLSDPDRTAAHFIVHPDSKARLYRTGDAGRWLPDGTIELLGRLDQQVKVQGFRVEPGEIEAALTAHPDVRDALVTATGERHEDKRLAAYVVAAHWPAADGLAETLRSYLATRVPAYMVPTEYVVLEAFPLTANGKVDRKALPDVGPSAPHAAISDTVPATLAALVDGILGRQVDAADRNLLALGATSMDMIRIVNAVEEQTGVRLPLDDFYQQPTLAGLAHLVGPGNTDTEPPALARVEVINDPQQREDFKRERRGLRKFPGTTPTIALPDQAPGHTTPAPYTRRSRRHFRLAPVPLTSFGRLLGCLQERQEDGGIRRRYASAGGSYAVQTYLSVKPGRVTDVPAGAYYYDPQNHHLVELSAGAQIASGAYARNTARPAFEEAAFSLFLIADRDAIAPLYGDRSDRFALLEAGAMGQLLEDSGPPLGLGLCAVGTLESSSVTPLFQLATGHELLYSYVAGLIDPAAEAGPIDESTRETDRIHDLSERERRDLIAALRESS